MQFTTILIFGTMPKKTISFIGLNAIDLNASVKKIEQQSISDETRKQYENNLKFLRPFLTSWEPLKEQSIIFYPSMQTMSSSAFLSWSKAINARTFNT